jgi:hypothetical protein
MQHCRYTSVDILIVTWWLRYLLSFLLHNSLSWWRSRHVRRKYFSLGLPIHHTVGPILCSSMVKVGVIGEGNSSINRVFHEVSTNSDHTFEVTKLWGSTKSPHRHFVAQKISYWPLVGRLPIEMLQSSSGAVWFLHGGLLQSCQVWDDDHPSCQYDKLYSLGGAPKMYSHHWFTLQLQ